MAIPIFCVYAVYLYFGPIKDAFVFIHPVAGKYSTVVPVLFFLLIAVLVINLRRENPLLKVHAYLNVLMSVLIIMAVFQLLFFNRKSMHKELPAMFATSEVVDTLPDIYYIVFDGYTSSRTLQQCWNHDNTAVDTFFRNNHFYYPRNSRSNYNFTSLSIGSILNMAYNSEINTEKIQFKLFWNAAKDIKFSAVPRFLKKCGYEIVNKSVFEIEGGGPPAIAFSYLHDSRSIFFSKTFSYNFIEDIGWNFELPAWLLNIHKESHQTFYARKRKELKQMMSAYEDLKTISARPENKPLFVYGHILLPHDPYYFDSTGRLLPEDDWLVHEPEVQKARYLSQLKYCNTLIRELVDKLIRDARRPRVIIIQSDHGYRSFPKGADPGLELNNLMAVRFPDGDYRYLYDSISAVNTFRVVFKKYFNEGIPLLKDSAVYLRH